MGENNHTQYDELLWLCSAIKGFPMPVVDVRNMPTVVEFAPDNKVVEFTETNVTAQVVVGPTVVEFSWGELIPEPGLSGGGVFEGRVYIRPDIPTLPTNSEPVDPNADYIMLYDASGDQHVKVLAALGGGGGGGVEFATVPEAEEAIIADKAIAPDVAGIVYDRLHHDGQHTAGKGTETVQLFPNGVDYIIVNGALSNVFEIDVDRDIYFDDPINPVNGQTINIWLKQNVAGGWGATFSPAWTFVNKIDPTLTPDPGAKDLLSCQWNETDQVMGCSFLPNYGAGYIPPPYIDDTDLTFVNMGGGEELVIGRTGLQVQFRTLTVSGDLTMSRVGDTVQIAYTMPTATVVSVLNDLTDVDAASPPIGSTLMWDGSQWVDAPARRWTVGATWTNGPNDLIYPVNNVNSVVSENCNIVGWYLLTDGGTGSCVVDILRVPVHEFPPLNTDTICGGNKPDIVSTYMATDTDLISWDVVCTEGDLLQFRLDSVSGFTMVQLILILEKRV